MKTGYKTFEALFNDGIRVSYSMKYFVIFLVLIIFFAISLNPIFATHDPTYRHPTPFELSYLSPLKQIQSGIPFSEIQCRESLTLLLKHDGSPSCVKSETAEILKHRGWADRIMNNFCFGEYLPVCGEDNVTYGNQCYLEREHVELKYLGECKNFILSDYNLDETEFLQIKNNMENVGYHICDIQLDENTILIKLNWIFEGSEPEKMILSNIPSNVKYEIKYLDGYANYFISKESAYSCED